MEIMLLIAGVIFFALCWHDWRRSKQTTSYVTQDARQEAAFFYGACGLIAVFVYFILKLDDIVNAAVWVVDSIQNHPDGWFRWTVVVILANISIRLLRIHRELRYSRQSNTRWQDPFMKARFNTVDRRPVPVQPTGQWRKDLNRTGGYHHTN